MRNTLSILCFILVGTSFSYSQEKTVKVDGIVYIVDPSKGTAGVGKDFKKDLKGSLEGDIVLASIIKYKKKIYPVTFIETNAFYGCNKLNSITISNSIYKLKHDAFACTFNLKYLLVAISNPYFKSSDGILFNVTLSEILRFPSGRSETFYSIPSTVLTIGDGAFSWCKMLKNIEIPNSVIEIKQGAFYSCDFTKIILPDSVAQIGEESFSWCEHLTSITLPPSVSQVGKNAFFYCNNLVSVTYQNKEMAFPANAFEYCSKLTSDKIIYETPKSLFLELANKGNPNDQYKLAMYYMEGDGFSKDVFAAKDWLIKAAANGHGLSQKVLGDIYFKGIGVEQNYDAAIKCYSKAVLGSNASAQTALGNCYFLGMGVKQNFSTAIKYYKEAASQGDIKSEEALGNYYYIGYGDIQKNYGEAVNWLVLSANNGNAQSAYYLAICYNGGLGINKNISEALRWIEKAVTGGIEKGRGLYRILAYDDAVKSMNSKYYFEIYFIA